MGAKSVRQELFRAALGRAWQLGAVCGIARRSPNGRRDDADEFPLSRARALRRLGRVVAAAFTVAVVLQPQCALSQVPANPAPTAGFQDGFFIQTADGANRLSIGMIAQVDGRFSLDDVPPAHQHVYPSAAAAGLYRPRRQILRVQGDAGFRQRHCRHSGCVFRPSTLLELPDPCRQRQDAHRVRNAHPRSTPGIFGALARIVARAEPGRRRAGVGRYRRRQGVLRRRGLQRGARRRYFDLRRRYQRRQGCGWPDSCAALSIACRPRVHRWRAWGFRSAARRAARAAALPTFRTSVLQPYFSYVNGATASGTRNRITPAVFYYRRSFGAFAEYMRSTQVVARNGLETDVSNRAWDVTASYLLTGETATTGIIRPKGNFDPGAGNWGAFQIAMRYAVAHGRSSSIRRRIGSRRREPRGESRRDCRELVPQPRT